MNYIMSFGAHLIRVNIWRTIAAYFINLKWKDAVKFPIVVCRGSKFKTSVGGVIFNCPIRFGLLRVGSRSARIVDCRYERTIIHNEGKIFVNGYTWIGVGCRINVYKEAELHIGNNFKVTGRTTIMCRKMITIGADCLFSWDIQLMDSDFHKIYDENDTQINFDKGILIGDHVWIGARSTVLKGAQIPTNSIVAAGSLFSGCKNDENCIYAGQGKTLKIVKDNVWWSDM